MVPARSFMAMALARACRGAQRSPGAGIDRPDVGAAEVLPGRAGVQLHAMPGRFGGVFQVAGEVGELLDLRGKKRVLGAHVLTARGRADELVCAATPRNAR